MSWSPEAFEIVTACQAVPHAMLPNNSYGYSAVLCDKCAEIAYEIDAEMKELERVVMMPVQEEDDNW